MLRSPSSRAVSPSTLISISLILRLRSASHNRSISSLPRAKPRFPNRLGYHRQTCQTFKFTCLSNKLLLNQILFYRCLTRIAQRSKSRSLLSSNRLRHKNPSYNPCTFLFKRWTTTYMAFAFTMERLSQATTIATLRITSKAYGVAIMTIGSVSWKRAKSLRKRMEEASPNLLTTSLILAKMN